MFYFESQFIKTDVTAVKILRNYYLVGVGGYLHVFDKNTYKLITKIYVFEGQKIYEIIPDADENKILLYGGRYLKVITTDQNFTCVNESACKIASDWILAAKWTDNYQQIVTVSIHNRLQIWNTDLEGITEISSEEKCILYSAFIYGDRFEELVILSGTVFSEVLIWRPDKNGESLVLKRLQKHKGVIFSVHYNEVSNYICSSSDDRSAVVWKPKNENLLTELEQENIEINITCHVFGHFSRIFRCHILQECFLTVGEDSLLNIWTFDGSLIRKIETSQGGPVWAIDADENDNIMLIGSSDCAATLFPINCNFEEQTLSIPDKVPKNLTILANNNLVVVSESGTIYYYIKKRLEWVQVHKHYDLKSYCVVVVSKCRNLVALAGFHGQIYIYKQENDELHEIVSYKTKTKSRIFSLHWISCTTFLTCQSEGIMTVYGLKNNNVVPLSNFILPPSKERWSTTAVFTEKNFVVGDRKGNLHLFELGRLEAVQTLKKVHSYLGVTSLMMENNKLTSLGRNATIKTFTLKNGRLHLNSSNKLPFMWLANIIGDLLLAFSGDKFVLWNHEAKRVIFEKSCGGGHRSWDFHRTDNKVVFSYIKDKKIHVDLILNNFSPVDLIESFQVKEINSVKIIKVFDNYVVVSGGEDTTLRINLHTKNNFISLVSLKPHLSSIRTIATYKVVKKSGGNNETYLVFSGGGRAQIICWKLEVLTTESAVKDVICSEQHSYYKIIDCEESEMRIMDLVVTSIQNQLLLFAACSDGNIKIFFIDVDSSGKYCLKFYRDVFYKLRCILKLCKINIFSRDIFATMATDGQLVFWDMSNICRSKSEIKWFHSIQSHQSGINSYDYKLLNDNLCLFLTGGDDNAIVLNLVRFQNKTSVTIDNIDIFTDSGTHCAQITGVFLSDKYFITASIDQRIAIFEWQLLDEKLICKYITKYNTAVADLQGLCCFENSDFDAFVYGKGIEYIKIKKKS
ncbi:WD repeat-containing protein 6 [Anoplophora glabripennis]|uniref:WD repeat-containing protein 6 n=1 Tax=Anoplophora glabripennis TaxID=217634 RepID=UPI000875531A|nr:WD repeat-containing protein 6 [Anoplophora glabripennis]